MSSIGYVSGRSTGSWVSVSVFWLVQVSALLVFFVPFTWGMVGLWALMHFSRAIGLTLAFHRYFAHRSFKMGRVTQFFWALVGTSAMQKGPLWWAGHHVTHHKYADRDGDPHSPHTSGLYYAHIGWFTSDVRYNKIERNNWLTAIFAVGEGWHNNHHRYQRSARNGFYWWEFDPTYYVIALMGWLGLAWDIQPVPERIYREA
jgi:fatty-acid desaturase